MAIFKFHILLYKMRFPSATKCYTLKTLLTDEHFKALLTQLRVRDELLMSIAFCNWL